MDKKKSILNITVSLGSKGILLVAALLVRRLLIRQIGNDVNGLNSLFASVVGMLAIAELGIGRAIVYSMYRPIVGGDRSQVGAIYDLYKRLYRIIGVVIFLAGLVVMPFLPLMIKDYAVLRVDVSFNFFLTLVSVSITYLYGAKTSLIEAHKDNYVTTAILTVSNLIRYILQAISLVVWASFPVFLICRIISTLVVWGLTELVVRRRYSDIINVRESLDQSVKAEIIRNVKAAFLHKVGTILVNGVDNLIISGFIGVAILGKYNNYTLIAGMIAGVVALFFTPLTSVVGHFFVQGDKERAAGYFMRFYYFNFLLGTIFFLGYYATIDSVIALLFGPGLEVSRMVAFIITLNQFTKYMRHTALLFRDASGTFYNDRWKPVIEGVVNLALSLLFVMIFPEDLRIVGVIVATIITTLLICHTVEPYIVFVHALGKKPYKFWMRNYANIGIFVLSLVGMSFLIRTEAEPFMGILVNGAIAVGMAAVVTVIVVVFDGEFKREVWRGLRGIKIQKGNQFLK